MQKRKLFIVLMAILTISLIGLSAQCGLSGEAPTIKLEIYDGPDYSEDDGMCYYRLETTVTGMPNPEVIFDDDDNVNPLGSGRVEVGVETGKSYTLTATATNKSGTASVSIVLSGDCEDAVADADADDDQEENGDPDSDYDADADEDDDADDDSDDDADADEDDDADDDADDDTPKSAPTISLAVYEGPTLEGSICYTRVEATVTGSPNPSVSFSKDDSSGSFGNKKAQVNINNPGDTYTLTATATNSEGSASATITIDWSCPIPTPDPIVTNVDLGIENISGYIIVEMAAYPDTPYTYVGDFGNNKQIKAFLSFNINSISSLSDVTITDASLTMPVFDIIQHPETMTEVHIKTFDFGSSLTIADQGAGGTMIKTMPTSSSMTSFNFSNSALEDAIQSAIDSHSQRFQLKISLSGINADGVGDWYTFASNSISLHIQYEVPG